VYDPNPTVMLTMSLESLSDWMNAWEGQWFIGVLDTNNKAVYILPIDPRSAEATANSGTRNRNRYASALAATPDGHANDTVPPAPQWASAPPDWETRAGGTTTHHRCLNYYHLQEMDCLGFTLIKVSRNGSFAQMKLTSNSLNQKAGAREVLAGHSFGRSTAAAAGNATIDARGLPVDSAHQPGKTAFSAGTLCMPLEWARALKEYLATQGIDHITMSLD
jgi:hypothetical protein